MTEYSIGAVIMRDRDRLRREHLRRMAEPECLRDLRRQAEQIRDRETREAKAFLDEMEMERLRAEIRRAGEQPCR